MTAPPIERRYLTQWLKPGPFKGSGRTVSGLIVPFEKRSHSLPGHVEIFDRTFANKSRADGFPGATSRFNCDDMTLLGSSGAKTLRFSLDDVGLYFEVDVPRALPLVVEYFERKDVVDIELVVQVYSDDWTHDEGYPVRRLKSGRLVEVNPLTLARREPVNTDAALQSLAKHVGKSLSLIETLSQRNALWELWGWTPRERTLLGNNGREAHVETIEAGDMGAPILNQRVPKSPADLRK